MNEKIYHRKALKALVAQLVHAFKRLNVNRVVGFDSCTVSNMSRRLGIVSICSSNFFLNGYYVGL